MLTLTAATQRCMHRPQTAELEVERALERKAQLEAQIAALHTDAEIEKQARERLGLIREGEIPVIVQPDAGD